MNKDYFEVLGVGIDASSQEIQHAYRELAKKYHPDINPGDKVAEEKMKLINDAYTVLSNKSVREKYIQEVKKKTNTSKKFEEACKQSDDTIDKKAKYKRNWQKMMNYYYETR